MGGSGLALGSTVTETKPTLGMLNASASPQCTQASQVLSEALVTAPPPSPGLSTRFKSLHLKSNLLCFPLTSGTNSPEEPSAKEASIPPRLPSVLVLGLSLPLLTGRLLSEVL